MAQLLGLIALILGLIVYAVQRKRRMAEVFAGAEHDVPAAVCSVPGAETVYDEVRMLRIALESRQEASGTQVSVHAGNGIGVSVSSGTRTVDTSDEREHAQRLLAALNRLEPPARAALQSGGVETGLLELAEDIDGGTTADRGNALSVLHRAEAVLSRAS